MPQDNVQDTRFEDWLIASQEQTNSTALVLAMVLLGMIGLFIFLREPMPNRIRESLLL